MLLMLIFISLNVFHSTQRACICSRGSTREVWFLCVIGLPTENKTLIIHVEVWAQHSRQSAPLGLLGSVMQPQSEIFLFLIPVWSLTLMAEMRSITSAKHRLCEAQTPPKRALINVYTHTAMDSSLKLISTPKNYFFTQNNRLESTY